MSLREQLSSLSVSNLFVYIADAVRYDLVPDEVRERGISAKTVSGSIFSPTSFATIVSGTYLPDHGVRGFKDALPDDMPTLLQANSHETVFSNTINSDQFNDNPRSESIISRTLGTNDAGPGVLETVPEPFVFVERGPGGHAPYGEFDGDAWEYFQERGSVPGETFNTEYQSSLERDVSWFESRLRLLKQRSLLDDTLVVYTSDHGELLGENGLLGHNGMMHRKLIETPTIFIHPKLDASSVNSGILRHVDLLPTLATAAGLSFDTRPSGPGIDLVSKSPAEVGASHYAPRLFAHSNRLLTINLSYRSVWDDSGGHVFADSGAIKRSTDLVARALGSSKRKFLRRHLDESIPFYIRGFRVQGTPSVSREKARECLDTLAEGHSPRSAEVEDVPEERLRELGYMQ